MHELTAARAKGQLDHEHLLEGDAEVEPRLDAGGEAPVAVPARDVRLEVAPPAAEPQGEVAHAKVAGGGSSDEAAAVERKTKRVSFAAAEFFAGFSEY